MELDAAHIGKMVRFHRKEAGLSRLELAELAAVGKTVVFEIEKGKPTVRLNTLFQVLRVLNIKPGWQSPLMEKFHRHVTEAVGPSEADGLSGGSDA